MKIGGQTEKFIATGEVVVFDGFLQVYREKSDDETEKEQETDCCLQVSLTKFVIKTNNSNRAFHATSSTIYGSKSCSQNGELGIGRPSTYAPTIQTIQNREIRCKRVIVEGSERNFTVITLSKNDIKETTKTGNSWS